MKFKGVWYICIRSERVRSDWIRKDSFIFLDVSNFPKERFVHKLVRWSNSTVRILHLGHRLPLFLAYMNRRVMHELLFRRVGPKYHGHRHHSHHNHHRCKLPLHWKSPALSNNVMIMNVCAKSFRVLFWWLVVLVFLRVRACFRRKCFPTKAFLKRNI